MADKYRFGVEIRFGLLAPGGADELVGPSKREVPAL